MGTSRRISREEFERLAAPGKPMPIALASRVTPSASGLGKAGPVFNKRAGQVTVDTPPSAAQKALDAVVEKNRFAPPSVLPAPEPSPARASGAVLPWQTGLSGDEVTAIMQRAAAEVSDPAKRDKLLVEMLTNFVAPRIRFELQSDQEAAIRERDKEQAATDRATRRSIFQEALTDDLVDVLDLIVAMNEPFSFGLLVRGPDGQWYRSAMKASVCRNAGELAGLAEKHAGLACLDMSVSNYSTITVKPEADADFVLLCKRFNLPPTMAWKDGDNGTVHLYRGATVIDDTRADRALMPGLRISSCGYLPLPPQEGRKLTVRPSDLALGDRDTGLPALSAELRDTLHDLRSASAATWGRYFRAMVDQVAGEPTAKA